jgi:hypothetical protein
MDVTREELMLMEAVRVKQEEEPPPPPPLLDHQPPPPSGAASGGEGRTYSDNTDDVCVVQCKICLKPIALDCFTYHIKKAHSILTQEYGEKKFLRRTYHR